MQLPSPPDIFEYAPNAQLFAPPAAGCILVFTDPLVYGYNDVITPVKLAPLP